MPTASAYSPGSQTPLSISPTTLPLLAVEPSDSDLSPHLPEVVLWTHADGAELADRVLRHMQGRIRLIAIGGPPSAAVEQLARQHGLSTMDDLRLLLQNHPATYLLLACPASSAAAGAMPPQQIRDAMKQGICVISLYPISGQLDAWRQALDVPADNGGFHLMPDFAQSPGWLSAADPSDVLTDPHSLILQWQISRRDGSLLGLTIDAMRCLIRLTGSPQSIDAALTGGKAYLPSDDDAATVTGHWHLHARLSHHACALLSLTDLAMDHRRRLTIRSSQASAEIDDIGYRLHDGQDRPLDHASAMPIAPDVAGLVAHQWQRLISVGPGPLNPLDRQHLLEAVACSLTAMLSCRTGQPESPGHLLSMA